MKALGLLMALGAFVAMLIAQANGKTDVIVIEGFLMVAGCIISLHGKESK